MFNSPLLDVTIGLVFIFLLYSLLATSINEAIATLFGFRARMLKNAIVDGMLSNTSKDGRWTSIMKGVRSFFVEISRLFFGVPEKISGPEKLGLRFFDHPLIKNYGASRIFPLPSYISTKNFSEVLIDEFLSEFDHKLPEISQHIHNRGDKNLSLDQVSLQLKNSKDSEKITELFSWYEDFYKERISHLRKPIIDRETLEILLMHLRNSGNDLEKFAEKIENWYDDTMKRVGGWYKRQSQVIVFIIGLFFAISCNVDVIQIAGKLSVDKEARDKLIGLSIAAVDKYKDDPRVIKKSMPDGTVVYDTSKAGKQVNEAVFNSYKLKVDSVRTMWTGEIEKTNDILAVGWGDYGKNDGFWCKIGHVLKESFTHPKKILGFLILSFAVSLGAPFWFDLLSKLVKVRSAGSKDEEKSGEASKTTIKVK